MGSILESLFPSTRRSLLIGFFRNPDKRFYLREVIRLVGKGQGTVQRELDNLVNSGILVKEKEHGRSYFRANHDCPVFTDIHGLVEKTAGVVVVLKRALKPVEGIAVAFVFGSVARGAERAESDIDLAVVGQVSFRSIVTALSGTHTILAREVNPVVYTEDELIGRFSEGDPFVRELISGPNQFVIGTADDLEAMVRQQVAG